MAENAANGTVVGTIPGATWTPGYQELYAHQQRRGWEAYHQPDDRGPTVAGTLLNYEAATSHSVTVRVTDRAA